MGPSKTNIIIGAARLDCSARLIFISSIWMFGFHIHEYRTMISTISMMPDLLKTESVHTLLSYWTPGWTSATSRFICAVGVPGRLELIKLIEQKGSMRSDVKVSEKSQIFWSLNQKWVAYAIKKTSETDVAAWVLSGRTMDGLRVGWSIEQLMLLMRSFEARFRSVLSEYISINILLNILGQFWVSSLNRDG